MHIIGLIIAVASAIFWVSRAAKGATEIANVAKSIKNFPRKHKFNNKASKRGIDLIDHPIEAATILMICTARLSDYSKRNDGLLSDDAQARITGLLQESMQLQQSEADDFAVQMRWTAGSLMQPDSALAPMVNIINAHTNRSEADELSDMLRKVSHVGGAPNQQQKDFIDRFRDRTGLSA